MVANAAVTAGEGQTPQGPELHKCGQHGSYGALKRSGTTETKEVQADGKEKKTRHFERDHVPAKGTLFERARVKHGPFDTPGLEDCINGKLEYQGKAIVIPERVHRQHSKTCGSKNKKLMKPDAVDKESMDAAVQRDIAAIMAALEGNDCQAAYAEAAKEIAAFDFEGMITKAYKDCGGE